MVITAVSAVNDLRNLGLKSAEYENQTHLILIQLNRVRGQKAIDYDEETKLINDLDKLEGKKTCDTQSAAIDLGTKTVRIVAGPAAGFATKVAGHVIKKTQAGSDQGLLTTVADTVKQQVTYEAWKKGVQMAADYAGLAGAVALVASTPLAAAAIAGVATASLLIPEVRETCRGFVASAAKGTGALIGASGQNQNQEIVKAYRIYQAKKIKLDTITEELEQNGIKIADDEWHLQEKEGALNALKRKLAKKEQILEQQKNALKDLEQVLRAKAQENADHLEQAQAAEELLNTKKNKLEDLKQQIQVREKKRLYRLVRRLNRSNALCRLLTRIFCALFKKYNRELEAQKNEGLKKAKLEKILPHLEQDRDKKIQNALDKQNTNDIEVELEKSETVIGELLKTVNLYCKKVEKNEAKVDQLQDSVAQLREEKARLREKSVRREAKAQAAEYNYLELIQT